MSNNVMFLHFWLYKSYFVNVLGGGDLRQIHGYRGYQNGSKCRRYHSRDICPTRENN